MAPNSSSCRLVDIRVSDEIDKPPFYTSVVAWRQHSVNRVISLTLLSKEGFSERMAERAMRQHGTVKEFYTAKDKR